MIAEDLVSGLPFDQFSRQKIVSYLIDEAFRSKAPARKYKIIDLGGHNGKTVEFQPKDKVTILDVFDESYKGYVKGDATKTSFADDSFDFVCSFDVFEHIPRSRRQAFVNEALRISKYGVFLTMPVDVDGKVSSAEILLNNFYKIISKKNHRWLKEHIDYRIPNEDEVVGLVGKSGASSVSIPSNQIGDWQLLQMLLFESSNNPEIDTEVKDLNKWYNQNTIRLDANIDTGYRRVFFISMDEANVERVSVAIDHLSLRHEAGGYTSINKSTFEHFTKTMALIAKKYNDIITRYNAVSKTKRELNDELETLRGQLGDFKKHNDTLTSQITAIYNSPSWRLTRPIRAIKRVKTYVTRKRG